MQSRTYEVTLALGRDATKPNSSRDDEQRKAASQILAAIGNGACYLTRTPNSRLADERCFLPNSATTPHTRCQSTHPANPNLPRCLKAAATAPRTSHTSTASRRQSIPYIL
jgi:hypothetical protein